MLKKSQSAPTVRFGSIKFSDGTDIKVGDSDIVVLVGPNNAGKSVALKELKKWLKNQQPGKVIKDATINPIGTQEDFEFYLRQYTKVTVDGNSVNVSGNGFSVGFGQIIDVKHLWPDNISHFSPLFCTLAATETRITEGDPVPAFKVLEEWPSHPIHLLYKSDELELKISDFFRQAFGDDLIVYRLGGEEIPLIVGKRETAKEGEDRLSDSYNERLLSASQPLKEQGDGMRSFASVILRLLAPTSTSVLLLDEPEAFLHPPQARLLGEIIASNKPPGSQLFVATHSPDVLKGLIIKSSENLHILRLQRVGDINEVLELDKSVIKEISTDPLMMQAMVMSGVFHERVVICESDADCMLYRSILHLPEVHLGRYPDVLFIHANGKHRMAVLAKLLVQLGVTVDVIADIDIIRDIDDLKNIVMSLNVNWLEIHKFAESINKAIEGQRSRRTALEIKKDIEIVLEKFPIKGSLPTQIRTEIQNQLRKTSPWDAVKKAGKNAIPPGDASLNFNRLESLCSCAGLWIVPVGEIEGFCRTVSGHGPKWVQTVLEEKDLSTDKDLCEIREFVGKIWHRSLK